MARKLADGCLCSEGMFGCVGDDEDLMDLLVSLSEPGTTTEWSRTTLVRTKGWDEGCRTWRAHGTLRSSRERVYVEVTDYS